MSQKDPYGHIPPYEVQSMQIHTHTDTHTYTHMYMELLGRKDETGVGHRAQMVLCLKQDSGYISDHRSVTF